MLIQELVSVTFGNAIPFGCDLLLLPLVALVALDNPDYETVWDVANRVCDRYFAQVNRRTACPVRTDA